MAMFSSADSALPARPLSPNRVNQPVQKALAGIRGAPAVEVVRSVGYGVTVRGGDIYVFQSAMGSGLDVLQTVFHELSTVGFVSWCQRVSTCRPCWTWPGVIPEYSSTPWTGRTPRWEPDHRSSADGLNALSKQRPAPVSTIALCCRAGRCGG